MSRRACYWGKGTCGDLAMAGLAAAGPLLLKSGLALKPVAICRTYVIKGIQQAVEPLPAALKVQRAMEFEVR